MLRRVGENSNSFSYLFVCDCVAKWLKHLTVNRKITGSSPTSYHGRKKKNIFIFISPLGQAQ